MRRNIADRSLSIKGQRICHEALLSTFSLDMWKQKNPASPHVLSQHLFKQQFRVGDLPITDSILEEKRHNTEGRLLHAHQNNLQTARDMITRDVVRDSLRNMIRGLPVCFS